MATPRAQPVWSASSPSSDALRAGYLHVSSRRKPGPRRRGRNDERQWPTALSQQDTLVVMGPGVRRDDRVIDHAPTYASVPAGAGRHRRTGAVAVLRYRAGVRQNPAAAVLLLQPDRCL